MITHWFKSNSPDEKTIFALYRLISDLRLKHLEIVQFLAL